MGEHALPTFDLVLATVDRAHEIEPFLASLGRQTYRGFRLLVVDQNSDDRLEPVLAEYAGPVVRLRADRGLSRARNEALGSLEADVVAFPDDDCVYPDDLLERVADRLARDPGLGGLVGRAVDADGRSASNWDTEGGSLTRDNVWHRGISITIFLRRGVVERVGTFDERLGLGASGAAASGEESDYLIRAIDLGERLEYDPQLVVRHPEPASASAKLRAVRYRSGASIGYLLRKHRYPLREVARMLVRPLGGLVLALGRGDVNRARTHLATFRGRVTGFMRR